MSNPDPLRVPLLTGRSVMGKVVPAKPPRSMFKGPRRSGHAIDCFLAWLNSTSVGAELHK